ncbi:hypothetical protein KUTeg_023591 [Tegillarca granosa]|uniref:Beta-1,4-N-acetylgalactosaminyltransferase bre-4 n=1 Tax=Tegillarca granosa TaxID=220873 RepID=A0ABQ9E6Z8_TEGGR|nr:hypothetical protein KUTeg_023591 [Tegillarca granosa]
MDFDDLENMFPYMKHGRSKPKQCKSEQRIAVIVPFRDRLQQLKIFLLNILPFLHRQQVDFTIYIVEQSSGSRFNRGMMRNIGFLEANLETRYDCFIFHDVDVLPEDDRNRYLCGKMPRHLSGLMDRHNYTLLYTGLLGGITAMTYNHFIKINGYSNQFFVWGGEDDELYRSCKGKI